MTSLNVHLLGDPRVVCNELAVESRLPHSTLLLLAYLLIYRNRHHSRDSLAGLFWGDHAQPQARNCLNTAIWRLRSVLEPKGTPRGTFLVAMPSGAVGFNVDNALWLDVAIFETQLGLLLAQPVQTMAADDAASLASALGLYTGDLLDGAYDDWVLRERERLRNMYLNGLGRLMSYHHHQRNFEASLACGQQILQQDPVREDVHRELMRIYLESGQRALAVRQFEVCRQVLASELSIAPMEETLALYAEIIACGGDEAPPVRPPQDSLELQRAVQELYQARQALGQAHIRLESALQAVERYARSPEGSSARLCVPPDRPAADQAEPAAYKPK